MIKHLWFKNISTVFHTYKTCIKRLHVLLDYVFSHEVQPEKRFHCISTCKIMLIDCNLVVNIHGSVVWQLWYGLAHVHGFRVLVVWVYLSYVVTITKLEMYKNYCLRKHDNGFQLISLLLITSNNFQYWLLIHNNNGYFFLNYVYSF